MSQVHLEKASHSHTSVAEHAFEQATKESIDTFERTLYRKDENTNAAGSHADNVSELLESIKAEAPAAPYSKRLLMNGPGRFLEKGFVMMTRNPDLSLSVGLRCTDASALKDFEMLKETLQKGEFGAPCSVHLEVAIQERTPSPSLGFNREQGENAAHSPVSAGSFEQSVSRSAQNSVGPITQGAFESGPAHVRSERDVRAERALFSMQMGSGEQSVSRSAQNSVGPITQGAFESGPAHVGSERDLRAERSLFSMQMGNEEQKTGSMDGPMPSMAAVADSLLRQVPSEGSCVIRGQEGSVLFEKVSDGSLSVSLLCADSTKERAFSELADAILKQCEKRGTAVSVSVQPEPKAFARELETLKKSSSSPSELLVNAFNASFAFDGPKEVSAPQVTTPSEPTQGNLTTETLEKLVQRILVAESGGTKEVRLTLGNSVLQGTDVVVSRSNDGMVSVRLLCSDQASFQTALESRQNLVEMLSRSDRNVSVSVELESAEGWDDGGNNPERRSQTYQEYTQDSDA